MPELEDDDALDGCEIDFTEFAVDELTAELLPLFPDSVPDEQRAAEWRDVGVEIAAGNLVPIGQCALDWGDA